MIAYLAGPATGLLVSTVGTWLVWPLIMMRVRLPGETWLEARDRELRRLDALAESEEIPETVRSRDLSDWNIN